MYDPVIYNITLVILFVGLVLLFAGFLLKDRRPSHLILILGWVLFGVFWLLQVPHFIELGDSFNAVFCFLGFVLFLYFSFHEVLNVRWNEYLYSLNYIAGVSAVAGIFYYLFERVEPLTKGLIYIVASQSVWVLRLFGVDTGLGEFGTSVDTSEISLGVTGTGIGIILACTGIQSIAIFVGILIVTKSDRSLWAPWTKRFLKKDMPEKIKYSRLRRWLWERKKVRLRKVLKMTDRGRFIRVFLVTIPVIYVLNIFRNALIIWGTKNEVLGTNTFNIAHNYLSKGLSLVVLIILLFIVFELLPEALEGIMGLLDLPKRVRRGMVKDGFIEFEDNKVDKATEEIIEQPKDPRARKNAKISKPGRIRKKPGKLNK
ncbi:archaeosortase A [[Eubacterium] cellulosolvens]